MNQVVNILKLDLYMGSTIDDSVALESIGEDSENKTSVGRSKIRIGSGNTQLKHHKGLLKSAKTDENCDEVSKINKNSTDNVNNL